jgi:hypothetical protein
MAAHGADEWLARRAEEWPSAAQMNGSPASPDGMAARRADEWPSAAPDEWPTSRADEWPARLGR